MRREFSAGGIVFKGGHVLLINNAAMMDPNKSYWGFPKGHIEEGESSKEAALREVLEETCIKGEIIEKVGDSKYVYGPEEDKTFKVVIMYLMEYKTGDLKHQDSELLGARWVTPEEALKMLSFTNDKNLLKQALEKRNGE